MAANKLNKSESNNSPLTSFTEKLSKINLIGWVLFFITLCLFLVQSFVVALKPLQVLGVDKQGRYVGQVLFDEHKYRSEGAIMSDLKTWVMNCVSVNKNTIYDDTSICLNHMEQELSEMRLQSLLATDFVRVVSERGCNKVDYNFNPEKSFVKYNRDENYFKSEIKGSVICNDAVPAETQEFFVTVNGKLTDRTTNKPIAIIVNEYMDIEK
jgi:hypothetical protein